MNNALIVFLLFTVTLGAACTRSEQSQTDTKLNTPVVRSGFALAYDQHRERVVLFGGQDSADVMLGDTWEWHGGRWHPVSPAGRAPSPRINAAVAYDQRLQKIVLFGGIDSTGYRNDTWSYNGVQWEQIATGRAPSPRQLATAAFDPIHDNLVLFGGRAENGARLGDTWLFEENEWHLTAENGPSPRSSHAMVYDDSEMSIMVYGGYDGNMLSDTWLWFGGRWQQMETSEGPARLHAAMVYDRQRSGTLVVGGFGERGRTNTVWLLKDKRWTLLEPEGTLPETRAEHEAAYIPSSGILIFGGVVGADPRQRVRANDTWLLRGGAWIQY